MDKITFSEKRRELITRYVTQIAQLRQMADAMQQALDFVLQDALADVDDPSEWRLSNDLSGLERKSSVV